MRVFVAGATGAIGARLVPRLKERGHEVIGTSRSMDRAKRLLSLGAEPVALDLLDRQAVREAVLDAKPDAVIHQATALTGLSDFRHFDRSFHQTNLLRTQGTDALLAAAEETGVGRVIVQSFASYRYAREGGPVKTEEDPLDPTPVSAMRETEDAMAYMDRVVTDAGGVVLRYGGFYGDPSDTTLIDAVRARKFPVVGNGEGVSSFIHLDDAAEATVLSLDHEGPAIYNIVDDEPAPIRVWLPELARMLGARPPRHFPTWLARIFAGEALVMISTEARGASNAKAKRELGWTLRYPSWRKGFAESYGSATGPEAPRSIP
jgi:2-alkyl-3-oxoalkanoate reductase